MSSQLRTFDMLKTIFPSFDVLHSVFMTLYQLEMMTQISSRKLEGLLGG